MGDDGSPKSGEGCRFVKQSEWQGRYPKIRGTQILQLKGGHVVRMMTASGKCFSPGDVEGALAHLEKLAVEHASSGDQLAQSEEEEVSHGRPKRRNRQEMTSDELEAQQRRFAEQHEERIEREERVLVSQATYMGHVVRRGRANAWVKPANPDLIPEDVRSLLRAMNQEIRTKTLELEGTVKPFCGGVEADVVYVRIADVIEPGLVLKPGVAVKFKLYTDVKGVGACELTSG